MFFVLTINAELPNSYFYAFGENNEITINWDYIENISDLLGCNLLRSDDYCATFSPINDYLIVSEDSTFTYLDEDGVIDTTFYYYKINYVFSDSSYTHNYATGALKIISFEIIDTNAVELTCVPRQTGSYEFELYLDGCALWATGFEDTLVICHSVAPGNYIYDYVFIKLPEWIFFSFFLTENFLYSLLNPVGIQEDEITQCQLNLFQNYPNPFNPTTTISFSIPEESKVVELIIYNIKGQLVKILVKDFQDVGEHSAIWNGDDESGTSVSSGIYFYKLEAGDFQKVRKMILLK